MIDLTDEFEGSIIRVFRRLEELMRQLAQVSVLAKKSTALLYVTLAFRHYVIPYSCMVYHGS